ncbi:unnamed protein product, partial [Didymodactylos carnosus]
MDQQTDSNDHPLLDILEQGQLQNIPQTQQRTPPQNNQSTSTSDLEITAVIDASIDTRDDQEPTTPSRTVQPSTTVLHATPSRPVFIHIVSQAPVSPPSPRTNRQMQYKQQGSRKPQILRRIRQTIGNLEEIPIFPVAKRPRTGTPLPASPPPSHRHFAPSVASSPAILKLPVPLVPTNLSPSRVPANISPPRGITESTITLAPITALPPRTTGNIQPAVTSNA